MGSLFFQNNSSLDMNEDGVMSAEELKIALLKMKHGISENEIAKALKIVNRYGDENMNHHTRTGMGTK